MELNKKDKTGLIASRRKTRKIKAEINQKIKKLEKMNKTKNWIFGKVNTMV